jgi:GH25 family lysozyme M1 (1,4-beta-N-acetylmuramidase)
MTTILGIGDASDNDTFDTTSWDMAAMMGCRFGIYRATTTGKWVNLKPGMRIDGRFAANTALMDAAGLERMAYQWFDPRLLTGEEQAAFYLAACSPLGGPGSVAVVDVEPGPGISYNAASVDRLRANCLLLKAEYPRVGIYSYPSFIDQLATLADISWMREFEWFCAHWDVTAPRDPWPWHPGGHMVWQYTASMLGSRYGFNRAAAGKPTPRICMAVKEA